jgi:histidinol-phosphate aminotransferase
MASFPELRGDLGVMDGYHSPQLDVEVRLNTNESPYPPPRSFLAELAETAATLPYHRYPDRHAWALREDLARWHGVQPEQVFVANGSNEVIQCLLLAYGGGRRTAAVFEPTYAMHGNRAADFTIDPAEVRRVVARAAPAVTFLCSPNNPTGTAESRPVLDEVLEIAPGLVLVDEAYGQFASWTAVDLVDDDLPLVVTRTYSKTWSMAGARLGYLLGPARVVEALWEKAALPYHLDALKQAAGRIALRHVEDMETRVAALVGERRRVQSALAAMDVDTWPSEANFVLFRPRSVPGHKVWERLVQHSVLVRDCSSWPRLEDCLRVTVGTEEEDGRFLAALEEALAS